MSVGDPTEFKTSFVREYTLCTTQREERWSDHLPSWCLVLNSNSKTDIISILKIMIDIEITDWNGRLKQG